MRLFPRIFLLCILIVIIFIIIAVRYLLNQDQSPEDIEDDAIINILQALPEDSQASEGLNQRSNPPPLTLNIAIILVVSLLTVALLITGICCIIIVAVTMDPTLPEDGDPLVPELNSCSSDNDFDDGENEDLYFDPSGKWKAVRNHFPSDIFEDLESGIPKMPPQRRKSFSH
uniref:Uncharacterized protein n=1 Tax=Panagrolaimus superbus TaxID=310955 RepID=A0A914XXV0_9BILA